MKMYEDLFKRNEKALNFIKQKFKLTDVEINSLAPISATLLHSCTIVGIAELMTEFAQRSQTKTK